MATCELNSRVRLLGRLKDKGAIMPPSVAPLPIPGGALGTLTIGISAKALFPPSLPHRLILLRRYRSPTPLIWLNELVAMSRLSVCTNGGPIDFKIDVISQ